MLDGKELFQFIWNKLREDFEEKEKNAITRSILIDLAKFKMPWNLQKNISPNLILQVEQAIKRINEGEPSQYVCGMAPFRNYLLHVNKEVLIPRPETEELVSIVLNHLDFLPIGKGLDVGTGSGAISIAISLESSREMDALDISKSALMVAKKNIEKYSAKVNPIHLDILNDTIFGNYSFIVSNPPYICESEKSGLSLSVSLFEPQIALFVPDKSPLLFYEKIIEQASRVLLPDGALFFECHFKYARQVAEMMMFSSYSKVEIINDLSGKQRMVLGYKTF